MGTRKGINLIYKPIGIVNTYNEDKHCTNIKY